MKEPDWLEWTIRAENHAIPVNDTFYACHLVEVPKLADKHHIVAHEPIIQKGNEGYVHHMILYNCWIPPKRFPKRREKMMKHYDELVKDGGFVPCRAMDCDMPLIGWVFMRPN